MNIAIVGNGRMGRTLDAVCARRDDVRVIGHVGRGGCESLDALNGLDAALDFSAPENLPMLLSGAAFYGLLALGEAAAHGTLTALLTLPVKNGAFRTAVLYQGVGCSVAAFFLSNAAIAKIGVNKTSSFIGVSTIVSILAGALALGEPLHIGQIIGAAVIVAGVYTANRT